MGLVAPLAIPTMPQDRLLARLDCWIGIRNRVPMDRRCSEFAPDIMPRRLSGATFLFRIELRLSGGRPG